MFFLSKLFNIFFLPPGLFIILIIISILFIIKNKIKTGIITLIITTLIFYLLSILPIKNLLLIPLEFQKRLEENTNTEFDTIVILSGGTSVITPDRNMKNSLSYESFQRTYMGFILWKIKKVPIIVSGGKSFGSIEADAITMENVLIELGIPKDQIIKEIRSIFKDKKIHLIFQPHLFSRTYNFFNEFVNELKNADRVSIVDIYPAREDPRLWEEKISSYMIYEKLKKTGIDVYYAGKSIEIFNNLVDKIDEKETTCFIGAGDMDQYYNKLLDFFHAKSAT